MAGHGVAQSRLDALRSLDRLDILDVLYAAEQPLSERQIRRLTPVREVPRHLRALELGGLATRDEEGRWSAQRVHTEFGSPAQADPLALQLVRRAANERRAERMRQWEDARRGHDWESWADPSLLGDTTMALTREELFELSTRILGTVRSFREEVGAESRPRPEEAETVLVLMAAFPLRAALDAYRRDSAES